MRSWLSRNRFLRPSFVSLGLVAGIAALGCGEARQSDVQPSAPLPEGVIGTLRARIASYEDHAETSFRLVREGGEELSLDVGQHDLRGRIGQKLAVRGPRDGNRIHVDAYDVIPDESSVSQQPLKTAHNKRTIKIAAISLTAQVPKDMMAKRVFSDPDGPAAFYRDNSYGDWSLEGDAYGPYTISIRSCAEENLYPIVDAAAAAAAPDGFDASKYDNIMYFINGFTSCTYGGIAEVGINEVRGFTNAKYSWYRGTGCVVLAQELGHNFGLLHSHSCTAPPYGASAYGGTACGGYMEYGDTLTPMGGGCGHFNAPESAALAFISGCNTLDVTSSGTYEIGPMEAKCSGPQVIRVPIANSTVNVGPQYVYVEYRRGSGAIPSDTRSPAGIHFHASAEYGGNKTTIDSGAGHDYDYALDPFSIHAPIGTVDGSWTEPASGATFTLKTIGETATVEVTLTGGGTGAAKCIDGNTPPSAPMCAPIVVVPPDGGAPPDSGRDGGSADAALDAGGGTADAAREAGGASGGSAGTGGSTGGTGGASGGTGGAGGSGGSSSGCSCSVQGSDAPNSGRLALLGLALLVPAVRRRRPRRGN
jgi:MYXO-CTERM domain-containing protein